jgi:hypothetical protein
LLARRDTGKSFILANDRRRDGLQNSYADGYFANRSRKFPGDDPEEYDVAEIAIYSLHWPEALGTKVRQNCVRFGRRSLG